MKALVTGATGFIGSHLVEELLNRGYEIKCIVRKTSNIRWLEGKRIEIVYGSLFDREFLKDVVRDVDYIYHIAGVTKGRNYDDYYRGNVLTTGMLLEASLSNERLKKFILASSLSATGPSKDDSPVDESAPYNPITAYGKSKMEAEKLTLEFSDRIPVTIIRPPSVYGPRDSYTFELFKYLKFRILPVILQDEQRLSLIYVSDLVDGFILAGESERSLGQIYFISSEEIYTWGQIEEAVLKAFGKKVLKFKVPKALLFGISAISEFFFKIQGKPAPLNIEKAKDITQKNWSCSPEKAKRELGFRQKVSLEDGMERTIRWYVENKWL